MSSGLFSDPFDSHPENPFGSQFRWPKAGGSGKVGKSDSTPETHPQARENQPESSDVYEDESKPAPENQVHLKNPLWNCDTGVLNDPVTVQVEADLPPEHSHLTRIVFTLFAQLKSGRREQIETLESHIKEGVAKVEFLLRAPSAVDIQSSSGKISYQFTAKHRYSKQIESPILGIDPVVEKKGNPHSSSTTSTNNINITFDPSLSKNVGKCNKIVHVQFNRRTVDGVMIMPGKVHSVFSFKDKIATKDGWTVDCLKSETTPDYQQGTGVGSKNGSVWPFQ